MSVKCTANHLVAGFEEGSIALFDFRKPEAITELKAHNEPGGYKLNYSFLRCLMSNVMCC